MLTQITEKIELKFWDICIPLLSRSEWLRPIIGKAREILQDEALVKKIAIVTLIAFAGAATGMLAFSISMLAG